LLKHFNKKVAGRLTGRDDVTTPLIQRGPAPMCCIGPRTW